MKPSEDDAWAEARRRCRLSDEEVRMAKELGFQPKTLIRNISSPSQKWKAPVNEWVRWLHKRKFGSRPRAVPARVPSGAPSASPPNVVEFRNPDYPWPDKPDIPAIVVDDDFDEPEYANGDSDWIDIRMFERTVHSPSEEEITGTETRMLAHQCLFRWAAQFIAIAMSQVPEVERVAAFGAVAQPLKKEVPRFRGYRRGRIEVLHECSDLDLAVWMTPFEGLQQLRKSLNRGLSHVQDTPYGGVAHHQVDVHIFDAASGSYRGRLCIFAQCPKPGKRECFVPDCGAKAFLRQFENYRFHPGQFANAAKVVLYDRSGNFLVRPPRVEAKPVIWKSRRRYDDVPF